MCWHTHFSFSPTSKFSCGFYLLLTENILKLENSLFCIKLKNVKNRVETIFLHLLCNFVTLHRGDVKPKLRLKVEHKLSESSVLSQV
jgi:hypothetical protein